MNEGGQLVTPIPGADRGNVLNALREVLTAASNLRGAHSDSAHGRLTAYIEWATNAVSMLHGQVSQADVERLILTRGYERLLSGVGTLTGTDVGTRRVVNGLVSQELQQRETALEEAVKALSTRIDRWSGPEEFGLADTSVYIQHGSKLEEMDFASMMSLIWIDKSVRIVVPLIVMDELDALKEIKDRDVRWRAGYTLAVFDRLFAESAGTALLRRPDQGAGRGAVTMEPFFDPPSHVRLPINDDEIIDRGLAIQALAGREVTLLTYDTGQSMRARSAGLRTKKLSKSLGDQPVTSTPTGKDL